MFNANCSHIKTGKQERKGYERRREKDSGVDMRRKTYNEVRDVKGSCQQRKLRHLCLPQEDDAYSLMLDLNPAESLALMLFSGFGLIRFCLLFSLSSISAHFYSLTINTLRNITRHRQFIFKWTVDTRGHSHKAECVIRPRIHILGSCSLNILQWYQSTSLHHVHKYFMIHSCLCTCWLFYVYPGFTKVLYTVCLLLMYAINHLYVS